MLRHSWCGELKTRVFGLSVRTFLYPKQNSFFREYPNKRNKFSLLKRNIFRDYSCLVSIFSRFEFGDEDDREREIKSFFFFSLFHLII